jgi:carboxyl-terminal processing protease
MNGIIRLRAILTRASIIGAALLLAVPITLATPTEESDAPLEPELRHQEIARAVYHLADRFHYGQTAFDDDLSGKILDRYLESLDGNRQYFLASDIASFEAYRKSIDDAVREGEVNPAFDIFDVYRERSRERVKYAISLLDEEPDFTIDEDYVFDRSDMPWAADRAQLDDMWRKRVKNDALGLTLAGKEWDETREILQKRYDRVLTRVNQIKPDDVFEIFMNAYTHTLDPHSSYMSPRNSEEYRIQMSLSYDGIGASLQLQDEHVTIMGIIPGGPAALDGTLKPNDRIIGVGQGPDAEIVDVVGWRLDDVVELIRGPGGSSVRLQILPSGAAPGSEEFALDLTRDKIKLEAQAAQKKTVTIDRDGRDWTIGVVEVPSFYMDYQAMIAGEEDYTSTTRDVRKLIAELEEEGVDGLVMDLRGNGGGHLAEARALSGLFIPDGPVVQLRQSNGRIEVLTDKDPTIAYNGPLVVLVDRYSASASEIFAAAIQDYGRGIVVGQQTFGKGTVQNLFPLDRYKRAPNPGFGQLTLTIGKYYRVTGNSTQHRGVEPDIPLPSSIDSSLVGESTRDTALPWDQIAATDFTGDQFAYGPIPALEQRHVQRQEGNPDFDYLRGDIAAVQHARERVSVSLNREKREAEREKFRLEQLSRENERRLAQGLEPLASVEDLDKEEGPDFILDEAAEIVVDMADIEIAARLQRKTESALN